ncbi:MAG: hypothetical protein P1U36_05680 [Legionellaceae bacterium]|nr:hypothetical protein [Legionellaceae bacterium]
MRFFVDVDVAVYRDDVLALLNLLDGTIAPLQTLCDSPRESKANEQALEMTVDARRCIAEMLAVSELTDEETDTLETPVPPSSPTSSL